MADHRVKEDGSGAVQVEMQITCEGRTFNGAASGPAAPPERLKISAQATLQALDSCLPIFYQGVSNPTLVLDNLVEVSMRDFPVAVVMITASEKERPAPLVAACGDCRLASWVSRPSSRFRREIECSEVMGPAATASLRSR